MIELNADEMVLVAGGDAAATRQAGQNSWGEWGDDPIRDIIDYLSRMN